MKHIFVTGRIPTFVNIHHGNHTRSEDPLRGAAKAPFPSHSNLASKLTESLKSGTSFGVSVLQLFFIYYFTYITETCMLISYSAA